MKILPPIRKVALVGVSGRGRWAVDVVGADPRLQIVALVDRSPEALESARQQLHLPLDCIYSDLCEALHRSAAEVAIICTPMTTHTQLCLTAFEAGVHVLVEKGMTFSLDEAHMLVSAADAARVCFCVAQNYRYLPQMQAVAEILSQPDHPDHPGEVFFVDCIHHRYRPEPGTSTYPYAMVWDMGCHHFDMMLSLMGSIARVTAHSYRAPWSQYDHDANLSAFIEFANGAKANYALTHDAAFTNMRWAFQGSRGVLRCGNDVEGLQFQPLPQEMLRNGPARQCKVSPQERDVKLVLDTFIDYLNGGSEPGISGRNNLETMTACAMICQSASSGEPVERSALSEVRPLQTIPCR